MKFLFFLLWGCPVFLFAQGKVGINTTTPEHPFQVNVDSVFTNYSLDQQQVLQEDSLLLEEGQSALQTFVAGQSGHLAKITFSMGIPVFDVILIEVYRGVGPYGVQMAGGEIMDSSGTGNIDFILPLPLPVVTAGETLHVILTSMNGDNSWKNSLGNSYPDGQAQFFNGSAWSPLSYDMVFKTYLDDVDTASVAVLTVRSNGRVGVKNYLLPMSDGAAGEVITTNGTGSLSWADPVTLGQYDEIIDADGDTRIHVEESPDEDAIRIYTSGSLKLLMNSAGNIGVGTSVPAGRLHLRHLSSPESPHLHLMEYVFDAYSRIKFSNQIFADIDWQIKAKPDDEAADSRFELFYNNGVWTGNKITVTGTGLVGIGNDDPGAKLDIKALGQNQSLLKFSTEQPWVFKQTFSGDSSALSLQSTFDNTAFDITSLNGVNRAARFLVNSTSSKISLVPDGGTVGIGTEDATGKLHIKSNSTTADPQLRLTETSADDFVRIKMENHNDPGICWDITSKANSSAAQSKINLYFGHPGSAGDKMTITGEGNVGIGTTTPGNRLRVNGSSTSSQHVLSVGTIYSGNTHIRAVEAFSTPATGYGIGGYFVGGNKGIQSFGQGGSAAGTVTALEGIASGSAGTRIGVFGSATGGAINWAGHFGDGNVLIENTLQVDGRLKVGDENVTPVAGMIRYNAVNQDFEGFNGTLWVSLTESQNTWGESPKHIVTERYQFTSNDGAAGDQFGSSICFSGDYVIIGAPGKKNGGNVNQGAAYIFKKSGNTWTQETKLLATDGGANDRFGMSVTLDGDYALVGSPYDDIGTISSAGSVYVFKKTGMDWVQEAKLIANDISEDSEFGFSVSISGEYAIVGSPKDGGSNPWDWQGSAYIFKRTGSSWAQQTKFLAPDGSQGDLFGSCVMIQGDDVLVGAPGWASTYNENAGAVYPYFRTGMNWTLLPVLDEDGNGGFGTSISIFGGFAVIGAPATETNGAISCGASYIFEREPAYWQVVNSVECPIEEGYASFGGSVLLSDNYFVVTAPYNDGYSTISEGIVFIYKVNSFGQTYQEAECRISEFEYDLKFGTSIGISTPTVMVGAPGKKVGQNADQGAVYVYQRL